MQSTGQQRGLTGVWRTERQARWFFAAHLQGALGTGAGYVALLLLAYEQLGLGVGRDRGPDRRPRPGDAARPAARRPDRPHEPPRLRDRRRADRRAAFAGLVFAHGTVPLIALALAAGLGSALLRPATCALLPAVVTPASPGAANGLFGAVREIGQLIGPALAAGVLLIAEPELVLALNAVTFATSALLMTRLRGHVRPVAAADDEDAVPREPARRAQGPLRRARSC